jgi:hypothetical protein
MAVISDWIKPSTTVISDCWAAYRDLHTHGYTHHIVNHTIGLVDERTGAHTNTIEGTWRRVKAFLNPYNRMGEIMFIISPVNQELTSVQLQTIYNGPVS